MNKILYLLASVLSLVIFITEVAAQPTSNNQEILLCVKYQPDKTIFSPRVVFKSQSNTLLESTQKLIQDEGTSNKEEEKGDTLF